MLYLTGAQASLSKSSEIPQTDVAKSLGGYISSSPVPNNSLNELFDSLSMTTLKNKQRETIAIALVNKFDKVVKNIRLKTLVDKTNIAKFRIAAVSIGKDMLMEHINNRYDEPIQAEFYDTSFTKAGVELEIVSGGDKDDAINLTPFDITAVIEIGGIDGTVDALIKAFYNNENYSAKRLSKNKIYIESKSENLVTEPLSCDYVASGNVKLKFNGKFCNDLNNESLICEELNPGQAIGLWIQRNIDSYKNPSNEELISNYDEKESIDKVEKIELIFNYNIDE
jgi:hypothetical protein